VAVIGFTLMVGGHTLEPRYPKTAAGEGSQTEEDALNDTRSLGHRLSPFETPNDKVVIYYLTINEK